MKQLLSILFACCLSSSIFAQETKSLSDFDALAVSTNIKLELIKSNENKMEIDIVKGNRKDLKIKESSKNLSIYIKTKNNWNNNKTKARIKLYYTELKDLNVSAGANVFSNSTIASNSFDVNVSSGGSANISVETGSFDSNVSSGGSLNINGKASDVDIDASSGGSFNGLTFKCEDADLEASSGGSVSIWVTKSIDAGTSSGGSIRYKGDPPNKDLDRDKWSGGSITSM